MRLPKVGFLLISALLVNACATANLVRESVARMQKGPESPPTKTITNFSDGLRCMDELLLEYQIPPTTFLIESLNDNTGQISSGTRDMLITALAAMSKRSNSIRVIAYDQDSSNAIAFLERTSAAARLYQRLPAYDIRGSISQYDNRVAADRANAAVSTKDWGIGGDKRVSGDVLGIDLSVVRTADLSVVPAATSSNQVIIVDSGSSADADAVIKKAGIFFSFSLDRTEGPAQAVRNLLDLAAIELIGRLKKVPYWQCLDVSEENHAVRQEVLEWMQIYDRDNLLIPFVRRVLYIKGFFDANAPDATLAFQRAVVAYQQNVGVQQDGVVDHDFMLSLFKRRRPTDTERLPQTPTHGADIQQIQERKAIDIALKRVRQPDATLNDNEQQLEVYLNKAGYLYCYLQNGDRQIQRFFPNRFRPDNYLRSGQVVSLPGAMPFAIEMEPGENATITCFATDESVIDRLPLNVRGADFEVLKTSSMAALKEAFIKTALVPIGEVTYRAFTND